MNNNAAYDEAGLYSPPLVIFPRYAVESHRLQSYEDWPKAMHQTPEELSDASFFYISFCDCVVYFSCGMGFYQWENDDIPWEQHVSCSEDCKYLLLMKGAEYVEEIKVNDSLYFFC